ncbi:DUF1566 domain-containing protein [Chloroflexota bacterium]
MTRFCDNGDGTVTDSTTSLQWQRETDEVTRDYKLAEDYVHKLELGGHGDWRLPEKEELTDLALVENKQLEKVFPNLKRERYWANTKAQDLHWAENPKRIAYTVDFDPESGNYGKAIAYYNAFNYYVRAVRKAW